ncbi:hypothetical protein RND81_09G137000 [Saponaria officinalis]|uniref:Alpha 1,4-glycosyltransferase domain-containing protein n=1 Tax=Saponaria officinalis TaxID=3572 RepID=A0AAW1IKD1_SAPOF
MIWISPKKLFGKRELLSLESVLKTHPHGCGIILSRVMDSKRGRAMLEPLVRLGYRVCVVAPYFRLLFTNTPAQGWLERLEVGLVDPGEIPITQNLSNLLRLVVLYKYGGVYLDTDVIIIKDISNLKNSIGIQTVETKPMNQTTLNNAVLIFDKQHPMLLKFMEEFNSSFNGNIWGFNGPYLVTRVVLRHVNDTKIKINILPHMAFYPVDWTLIDEYFWKYEDEDEIKWSKEELNKVIEKSYGVHLWNKITHTLKIENGSILEFVIDVQLSTSPEADLGGEARRPSLATKERCHNSPNVVTKADCC